MTKKNPQFTSSQGRHSCQWLECSPPELESMEQTIGEMESNIPVFLPPPSDISSPLTTERCWTLKPESPTRPTQSASSSFSSSKSKKIKTSSTISRKGQKRRHSFLEALLSTMLGFLIALVTQWIVFPIFEIHTSVSTNLAIACIFTGVSIVRSYFIRRLFNYFHIKEIL